MKIKCDHLTELSLLHDSFQVAWPEGLTSLAFVPLLQIFWDETQYNFIFILKNHFWAHPEFYEIGNYKQIVKFECYIGLCLRLFIEKVFKRGWN